jgi:hypothetical protein
VGWHWWIWASSKVFMEFSTSWTIFFSHLDCPLIPTSGIRMWFSLLHRSILMSGSYVLARLYLSKQDNDQGGICTTVDKICMMTTRLACNRAIESSYWRKDNDSDVGLLMGYVLYHLPIELESMDLDTFPIDSDCTLLCAQVDRTRYSSIASGNNCIVQLCKCVSLHL